MVIQAIDVLLLSLSRVGGGGGVSKWFSGLRGEGFQFRFILPMLDIHDLRGRNPFPLSGPHHTWVWLHNPSRLGATPSEEACTCSH